MCREKEEKQEIAKKCARSFAVARLFFLALLFTFLQISNESVVLLTDIMQQAYYSNFILSFAFLYLHHTNCPTFLYRIEGGKSQMFVFGNFLLIFIHPLG